MCGGTNEGHYWCCQKWLMGDFEAFREETSFVK